MLQWKLLNLVSRKTIAWVAILIIGILIISKLLSSPLVSDAIVILCEWVASLGVFGPFALGLIDAVGVMMCFPFTLAFELAAGFLFGVVVGKNEEQHSDFCVCDYRSSIISVAKTVGAAAALVLGRTLLKNWVQSVIKSYPQFSEVYESMSHDSFKLAILLRLSPVPSWVNNYGLALTPISLQDFFLATILAGFPGVVRNVYLGSLMKNLSASSGEESPKWLHISMGALTVVATVLVTKYLYKYVSMAMKSQKAENEDLESHRSPGEEALSTVSVPPSPARQRIAPASVVTHL